MIINYRRKFVLLFSDASFCDETKTATYACLIHSYGGILRDQGVITGELIKRSSDAESYGCLMALVAAHGNKLLKEGDKVFLKTDSQSAIELFTAGPTGIKRFQPYARYVNWRYHQIRKKLNLKIHLEHVKAHTGRDFGKYKFLADCDLRARKLMRVARDEKLEAIGEKE